jgi:hypothetical protein
MQNGDTMTKQILRWAGITFAIALSISAAVAQLPNLPDPPYATVTYSDGSSVVTPGAGGTFALVGLQPNVPIQVIVQYPSSDALQLINLEPLDGGAVLPPADTPVSTFNNPCPGCVIVIPVVPVPLLTDKQASLAFTFVPGTLPGSYQIALRQGTHALVLHFWVLDADNPQNNPPAITPADPNNY